MQTKPGRRAITVTVWISMARGDFLIHFLPVVTVCVVCCVCCCDDEQWKVTSVSPVLLVFGMDHRAKDGSWDLILPTITSPELSSNRCYSVYCVLWTTTNIHAFIQHTHGLTLLQANRHTWTQTHTSAEIGGEKSQSKTPANKEMWLFFDKIFSCFNTISFNIFQIIQIVFHSKYSEQSIWWISMENDS